MASISLPFPSEPTADDARPLVERIIPILEAARTEEFIADAQAKGYHLDQPRRPDVERDKVTDQFRDDMVEALVQLGIAFYALHGNEGFTCDPSAKTRDPRRYSLEQYLHQSHGFVEWMTAEVGRRRRGPEIHLLTEKEEKIARLILALKQAFGDAVVLAGNFPPEQPEIGPTERVLDDAITYYRHVLSSMEIL